MSIQPIYSKSIPYTLLLLADPYIDMINSYIHESFLYGIQSGNDYIGVYALYPIDESSVEIKNIAVREDHQQKGFGKQLLQHALSEAHKRGFRDVLIGTGNSSIPQLSFYQKLGFEVTAIKKNFFIEHYKEPIYENGIQCKHMIVLTKHIASNL
ncbi:GNAT family N-acetyltransferase [Flavobacterium cerinum]|uniref:GNAT family N-acetyltransferase n=1 Tax=Flavobacterium cerinum TaxID=2502784 RepID=A0ABY5IUM0_9FLAO|nr:GNAT family N-acetyltransferase [Flavobacterium cerinum]UUC45034.1 GNAT family N-acetyltransferase [Flavobacterium cerinum]